MFGIALYWSHVAGTFWSAVLGNPEPRIALAPPPVVSAPPPARKRRTRGKKAT